MPQGTTREKHRTGSCADSNPSAAHDVNTIENHAPGSESIKVRSDSRATIESEYVRPDIVANNQNDVGTVVLVPWGSIFKIIHYGVGSWSAHNVRVLSPAQRLRVRKADLENE